MLGYREELYIRLRAMQMMIDSGVKIKKKTIYNTLSESAMAIHEVQSIEAKLNELEKDNRELRYRLATYEDAELKKQQVTDHEECANR